MQAREEVLRALEVRRDKLGKDVEVAAARLKALRDAFNKRRHQLLKACHQPLSKSVQRTESVADGDVPAAGKAAGKAAGRKSVHRSASFKVSSLNTVRDFSARC